MSALIRRFSNQEPGDGLQILYAVASLPSRKGGFVRSFPHLPVREIYYYPSTSGLLRIDFTYTETSRIMDMVWSFYGRVFVYLHTIVLRPLLNLCYLAIVALTYVLEQNGVLSSRERTSLHVRVI
jgi:hypothetical protein